MQRTVISELPPPPKRRNTRRFLRFARCAPLLWPLLVAFRPAVAQAYPGQGVVEGSRVLFGTLAVLALIGTIFASIFNRQYVREAMYSLVATFTLFAIVSWAPQLVSLVQQ
jgi:hypothetical protein